MAIDTGIPGEVRCPMEASMMQDGRGLAGAAERVATQPAKLAGARRYHEVLVVMILSTAFGLVSTEMFGVSFLMPAVKKGLHLSNMQGGLLIAGYWIPYAFASFAAGALTIKFGTRTAFLLMFVLFSVTSMLSGIANSFYTLFFARLIMGLVEGPILPIAQSIVAAESSDKHRGLNMGLVQVAGGSILGMFVAPPLLVYLTAHYGWHVGFFIVALPAFICAILAAFVLKAPVEIKTPHDAEFASTSVVSRVMAVLKVRNVWLCAAAAACLLAYLTIGLSFFPQYYMHVRHLPATKTSVLISAIGLSSAVFGVILPLASDYFGRKPVVILTAALGMLAPLSVLYYSGPIFVLAILIFVGWAAHGSILLIGTIPAESVPARYTATAIGLILAVATLAGGAVGPPIAGWTADHWGLAIPLFLQVGLAAAVTLLTINLRETAPPRGRRSNGARRARAGGT